MYCKKKSGKKCSGSKTRRSKTRRSKTRRSKTRRSKTRRSKTRRSKTRRSKTRNMRGGNGAPLPYVGAPYNAGSETQPSGNYYAYNNKVNPWPESSNPSMEGSGQMLGGGKKKNKNKKKNKIMQKGGNIGNFASALIPNDILNISRSIPAGIGHMYDKFVGVASTPSSMVYPTEQPLVPDVTVDRMMRPPNIVSMYNANNNAVSRL